MTGTKKNSSFGKNAQVPPCGAQNALTTATVSQLCFLLISERIKEVFDSV